MMMKIVFKTLCGKVISTKISMIRMMITVKKKMILTLRMNFWRLARIHSMPILMTKISMIRMMITVKKKMILTLRMNFWRLARIHSMPVLIIMII